MKEVKIGMGRRGMRIQEGVREWRLPNLLYADYFILYGESKEDLWVMVGCFAEIF